MKIEFPCAHCGETGAREAGQVNRARIIGLRLFCSRVCFGLDRRKNKTSAQKIAEKSEYDRGYRARNLESLKAKKRAHHKRTYDPVAAAKQRKKRMPWHVEYCRQPAYKAKKQTYDQRHRAEKTYGSFAQAFLTLVAVNNEITGRMSRYEVYSANDTLNKKLRRKKDATAHG